MPEWLLSWLYPELSGRLPRERRELLAQARGGSFDVVEMIGLAFALAVTVFLTRYSAAELNWSGRLSAGLLNYVVAIPLLVMFGGPFYLRRTRRHLHELLRNNKIK
ncbi:MAG: hypothetical protein ABL901_20920 [Hyphomicrobiaceae bacterium]